MPLSPNLAGFAFRAANAAKKAYCFWLDNQLQNNRDPYRDVIRFFQKELGEKPVVLLGPVLSQLVCDITPPPVGQDDFSGGQCECVPYIVEFEYRERFKEIVTGNFRLGGPIRGSNFREAEDSNGNPTKEFVINASLLFSDGTCQPDTIPVRQNPNLVWGRIIRVTRDDGLPDDCGDPPPPPPPPLGDRFDWEFDWEDDNGNSVSTDVSINIGPISFDAGGGIEFRVRMDLDFNVSLTFTFNGLGEVTNVSGPNVYVDGGGSGGSGSSDRRYFNPGGDSRHGPQPDDFTFNPNDSIPEGDEIEVPDGSDGDDYEEEEPDSPEKVKVIRGVAVTVRTVRSNRPTVIFQEGNPDIYAPSLGYINFRVKIGQNTTFWTNDLPVKNVKSFIPCPWEGGAIEVKGTPQPGVVWTLTPVYSRIEAPALMF